MNYLLPSNRCSENPNYLPAATPLNATVKPRTPMPKRFGWISSVTP